MKIAITSTEQDKNQPMDSRFGRCAYFALYNTEDKTYAFIENTAGNSEQGAGIAAAQSVIDLKIDVLLTGRLGPKAKQVIDASSIKTYFYEEGTIAEVVEKYLSENK